MFDTNGWIFLGGAFLLFFVAPFIWVGIEIIRAPWKEGDN